MHKVSAFQESNHTNSTGLLNKNSSKSICIVDYLTDFSLNLTLKAQNQ